MKNKMYRCWSVMCGVWYFTAPADEDGVCPACGMEGTIVGETEHSAVHKLWHVGF